MLAKAYILVLLVPLLAVPTLQEVAQISSLALANNQFGESLMARLAPSYDNMVISPYSLHAVLSMTALGARGDTLSEMKTALHTSQLTEVHQAYGQIVQSFNDTGTVDVLTANGLFQNPNYTIGSEFQDSAITWFDAVAKELNFSAPEGPEAMINSWVDENTNNMIPELLMPGTLSQSTILVLVNTLFFNGSWIEPFVSSAKANFTVNQAELYEVDMMSNTGNYQMKFEEDYQVLRVPFEGDRFALYFVTINDSAALLNPSCLPSNYETEVFEYLQEEAADIHIPKFEIKFRKALNDILKSMGMVKAFQSNADLSGISNGSFISLVLQEAVIKVTESGTTAAAASAVVISESSALVTQQVFKVDKPFFFYLRDDTHKEVLFQGKFTRPQQNPSDTAEEVNSPLPTCGGGDGGKDGATTLSLALMCWVFSAAYSVFGLQQAFA